MTNYCSSILSDVLFKTRNPEAKASVRQFLESAPKQPLGNA